MICAKIQFIQQNEMFQNEKNEEYAVKVSDKLAIHSREDE